MVFEVLGHNLLKFIIKSSYLGISIPMAKSIVKQVCASKEYLTSCSVDRKKLGNLLSMLLLVFVHSSPLFLGMVFSIVINIIIYDIIGVLNRFRCKI